MAAALGVSAEWWTAMGTLVGIATFLFSLWVHHRKGDDSKFPTVEAEFDSPSADEDAPATKWPPEAHFEDSEEPLRLQPLRSGSDLLAITRAGVAYSADNDDPSTAEEAERVGDAHSAIFGWVEAGDVIDDPGEWVQAGYELTGLIEELAEAGWTVYGGLWKRRLVLNGEPVAWPTAVIRIRKTREANVA